MKLLRDIDVFGKRVLVRGDLDVEITNDKFQIPKLNEIPARLLNIKPTVDYLVEHGAKQIVIAGHIGRPLHETSDGKSADREKLSTKNLIVPLEKILGREIGFQANVILGSEATPESDSGQARMTERGAIILLENLRFWEGEEKNDPEFARQLAALADIYINEAFGACHREHASIVGVPALLPHAAGLHLEEEVNELTHLIKNPQRPMVAIIGGAKLETKIPVIESLSEVADFVLVGGLIAREIANNKNYSSVILEGAQRPIGSQSGIDSIASLQNDSDESKVIVAELTEDTKDIDERSIEKFREIIKNAKTVVWNGPVGLFEEGFERGTLAIARAVIDSGTYSVIGGGETTEFLGKKGLLDKFSFVSSGGGAMLEFLSGKELPGIEALS